MTARVIPVIALHALRITRQHAAGDTVAGTATRTEEAVRIAIHAHARMRIDAGAVGIVDARIDRHRGGFAFARQANGVIAVERPGRKLIVIRKFARHALGRCKAGVRIFFGVARDIACCLDGFLDGLPRHVRGAGMTASLAEIHCHRETAVAGALQRFDLLVADRQIETTVDETGNFGGRAAAVTCEPQGQLDTLAQVLLGILELGNCHIGHG